MPAGRTPTPPETSANLTQPVWSQQEQQHPEASNRRHSSHHRSSKSPSSGCTGCLVRWLRCFSRSHATETSSSSAAAASPQKAPAWIESRDFHDFRDTGDFRSLNLEKVKMKPRFYVEIGFSSCRLVGEALRCMYSRYSGVKSCIWSMTAANRSLLIGSMMLRSSITSHHLSRILLILLTPPTSRNPTQTWAHYLRLIVMSYSSVK